MSTTVPTPALINSAGDVVLWVRDGHIAWASAGCEQFGWSPSELIGTPAIDLVHPDDRYLAQAAKENRDTRTEKVRIRFRLLHKSQGSTWVDAHASPHVLADGTVDGLVSVLRDVSGQVDTEHYLREREREFRLLAENAADIVIRFDASCTPVWICDSVRDVLGWEPADIINGGLQALIHPDDAATDDSDTEHPTDRINTGQEFRLLHRDGSWVWVSRRSRLLIDGTNIESLRCIDDEIAARTAAASALADLDFRSRHDPLTNLANRDEVIRCIDEALATCAANDESTAADSSQPPAPSVLVVGIDHFKAINSGLSHATGDRVLTAVGRHLRDLAPADSMVGRIGGDEFAIVLPDIEPAQAIELAQTLVDSVGACTFDVADREVTVTVSVGVATASARQHSYDLLGEADAALNEAKRGGRNRHSVANSTHRQAALHRIGLTNRIRAGIESGQFHAWYQPIVDLKDRKILGFEALARWITNDGVIEANEFIATAEDTGLIDILGQQVVGQAIGRIPDLPPTQTMSVNASASQLRRPSFARFVISELARHGANPKQLVIEITEHSLLRLDDESQKALASLTDLGVGIFVDDFGTGFSSLATLLDYPVTGLKLDRAFAQRLATDPTGPTQRLVLGLIELTNKLGLLGIAEGVESEEQESLLRTLGWHCGQGWLFGHAEPPQEYTRVPRMRRPDSVDVSDGARTPRSNVSID